jgi:hypothetical protein
VHVKYSPTAHIAVLDASGTIIAVNEAWRGFARENGIDEDHVSLGVSWRSRPRGDGWNL